MPTFESLKETYEKLWSSLAIRPERLTQVKERVADILQAPICNRYKAVQSETGVPWMVIGCIHSLESNLSFNGHLHNGDPLTARTVHVPKGRPKTGSPPFSWEESAVDALQMKQGNVVPGWSIAACLYYLEAYNGWGYQTGAGQNTTPKRRSPYLWSFTRHYERGKYTYDGHFDPAAVSKQIGAAALLRILIDETGLEPRDLEMSDNPMNYHELLLIRGSRGQSVIDLQKRLLKSGFSPGEIDGIFGPLTQNAVKGFQMEQDLEADGVVGPQTWGALLSEEETHEIGETEQSGLRQRVLAFAIGEAAKGRRHAPDNEIDRLVLDPMRPIMVELGHLSPENVDGFFQWCASWINYITRHEGVPVPDRYDTYWASTALVDAWRHMGLDTNTWYRAGTRTPAPGDIVVYNWDSDSDTDHIGVLKEYRGAHKPITACEGNARKREAIMDRSLSDVAGYIDIEALNEVLSRRNASARPNARTKQRTTHRK